MAAERRRQSGRDAAGGEDYSAVDLGSIAIVQRRPRLSRRWLEAADNDR
jgi:hypothetical protein